MQVAARKYRRNNIVIYITSYRLLDFSALLCHNACDKNKSPEIGTQRTTELWTLTVLSNPCFSTWSCFAIDSFHTPPSTSSHKPLSKDESPRRLGCNKGAFSLLVINQAKQVGQCSALVRPWRLGISASERNQATTTYPAHDALDKEGHPAGIIPPALVHTPTHRTMISGHYFDDVSTAGLQHFGMFAFWLRDTLAEVERRAGESRRSSGRKIYRYFRFWVGEWSDRTCSTRKVKWGLLLWDIFTSAPCSVGKSNCEIVFPCAMIATICRKKYRRLK